MKIINNLKGVKFLARGHRGIVYSAYYKNKKVVVKKKNPKTKAKNVIKNEAEFLKLVNKKGIGPKLLEYDNNYLICSFIDGIPFNEFIKKESKERIKKVIEKILKQCFILDSLGINKEEMHRPYKHIIINPETLNAVLIDFERSHYSKKPKNVTQFLNYLTSKNISKTLKEKGININKKELILLAKEYKRKMTKKSFKKIIKILSQNHNIFKHFYFSLLKWLKKKQN